MSADCPIIVMAKAPVPGQVKTRLIPALGAEAAAALARRMLEHALAQAVAARLGPVELCIAPDASDPWVSALVAGLPLQLAAQGEGDLGERMHRAFTRVLVAPVARALLIGSDVPGLDAAVLREAAAVLTRHDAVFVPALDGGYALVGLRRPAAQLFEAMAWSTPTVMQQTRERLAASGLSFVELAPLPDIDEAADLVHLPPAWRSTAIT